MQAVIFQSTPIKFLTRMSIMWANIWNIHPFAWSGIHVFPSVVSLTIWWIGAASLNASAGGGLRARLIPDGRKTSASVSNFRKEFPNVLFVLHCTHFKNANTFGILTRGEPILNFSTDTVVDYVEWYLAIPILKIKLLIHVLTNNIEHQTGHVS